MAGTVYGHDDCVLRLSSVIIIIYFSPRYAGVCRLPDILTIDNIKIPGRAGRHVTDAVSVSSIIIILHQGPVNAAIGRFPNTGSRVSRIQRRADADKPADVPDAAVYINRLLGPIYAAVSRIPNVLVGLGNIKIIAAAARNLRPVLRLASVIILVAINHHIDGIVSVGTVIIVFYQAPGGRVINRLPYIRRNIYGNQFINTYKRLRPAYLAPVCDCSAVKYLRSKGAGSLSRA